MSSKPVDNRGQGPALDAGTEVAPETVPLVRSPAIKAAPWLLLVAAAAALTVAVVLAGVFAWFFFRA